MEKDGGVEPVSIIELQDGGDARGRSFPIAVGWMTTGFKVDDAHVTTIVPGAYRGNHFHVSRNEILIVMFADDWSLHWDCGAGTMVNHRGFSGAGAVVVQIAPGASHAVRNDGARTLHLVGLTDGPFDPAAPDAFHRDVVGS